MRNRKRTQRERKKHENNPCTIPTKDIENLNLISIRVRTSKTDYASESSVSEATVATM